MYLSLSLSRSLSLYIYILYVYVCIYIYIYIHTYIHDIGMEVFDQKELHIRLHSADHRSTDR